LLILSGSSPLFSSEAGTSDGSGIEGNTLEDKTLEGDSREGNPREGNPPEDCGLEDNRPEENGPEDGADVVPPPEKESDPYLDYLEGHSHHGDAFNEGPRQAAWRMDGVGDVHLEITCANEEAQAFFDQGVGQLHGFWYFEAERSFRQVAALDPDCAMAYWGMAMANFDNEERAPGFSREAYLRRENVSARETLYVEAIARYFRADYEKELTEKEQEARKKRLSNEKDQARRRRFIRDFEEIIYEYPDEVEAKAFLVNQLWLNQRAGMKTPSRQANEALLDQIFEVNPLHPAHHYRVHLWDSRETAHRVVDSAAKIGHSAPGIAHMWHMGGHIWSKLKRHDDAAYQQEASARVDHAQMMRDQVLPDQIHNYAHNNEWLSRSLRNVGRVRESLDLSKNMIELPRHPDYNTPRTGGGSTWYGRRRLIETLELYELWDEAVKLGGTMYLEPFDDIEDSVGRVALLAEAYLHLGRYEESAHQLTELKGLLAQIKARRARDMDEAEESALKEGKKQNEVEAAMSKAVSKHAGQMRTARHKIAVLEALAEFSDEVGDERKKELRKTLEDKDYARTRLSRLCLANGMKEDALRLAKKAAESSEGIAVPIANYASVLYESGEVEEARKQFETLRAFSARFDLDVPVFERLAPLAKELGYADDWRVAYQTPDDVGERPNLADLGPFRWAPKSAREWTLEDGFGKQVSLSDYEGRPVLVIFFLGFGCVHCVEQLGAFKPMAAEYADAGIPIVTVGTDSIVQLRRSQEDDDEADRFPFPILSDPDLEVFKRYRAYDDFEQMALHGTFLIDAGGRVRWQDISYEPFMDPEWLLQECGRLLGLSPGGPG